MSVILKVIRVSRFGSHTKGCVLLLKVPSLLAIALLVTVYAQFVDGHSQVVAITLITLSRGVPQDLASDISY